MSNDQKYFLQIGNRDRLRLNIICRLYNPRALAFLQQAGLKSGMRVLEIGCGTGEMAIEMAKIVGPTGSVVATDIAPEQLDIAKELADQTGVSNIEFKQLDMDNDLKQFSNEFDYIYGRWVIEFSNDTNSVLGNLMQALKPGGIIAYEGVDVSDTEYFTYPDAPVVNQWAQLILRNWNHSKMDYTFIKRLYQTLVDQYDASDMHIATSQSVLTNAEDKAVIRLGLESVKQTYLDRGFVTLDEFNTMISDFNALENSNVIVGFVRNLLVAGRKKR